MEEKLNKRQQKYQATLEKIRASVDKLVESQGFDAMRIRDICSEAGISAGAFYHYFSSKDDLLIDRYKRLNAFQNGLYDDCLASMHPIDALKHFFTEMEHYTRTRNIGVFIKYITVQLEQTGRWEQIEPHAAKTVLARLVERGIREETIRPICPAAQLAAFLFEYYSGVNFTFCSTRGAYLEEMSTLPVLFSWLESLRA